MTAKVLDRRALLTEVRRMRTELEPKLAALVKGQHVVMTHDGWTDIANSAPMSTTYTVVNQGCEMTVVSPYCEKHEGNTTGEDLAKFVMDCG